MSEPEEGEMTDSVYEAAMRDWAAVTTYGMVVHALLALALIFYWLTRMMERRQPRPSPNPPNPPNGPNG